jgi:hypothetical protein
MKSVKCGTPSTIAPMDGSRLILRHRLGLAFSATSAPKPLPLKKDLSLVKRQTLWKPRQDIAGSQKRISQPHYGVIKLPVWATRLPDNQHWYESQVENRNAGKAIDNTWSELDGSETKPSITWSQASSINGQQFLLLAQQNPEALSGVSAYVVEIQRSVTTLCPASFLGIPNACGADANSKDLRMDDHSMEDLVLSWVLLTLPRKSGRSKRQPVSMGDVHLRKVMHDLVSIATSCKVLISSYHGVPGRGSWLGYVHAVWGHKIETTTVIPPCKPGLCYLLCTYLVEVIGVRIGRCS